MVNHFLVLPVCTLQMYTCEFLLWYWNMTIIARGGFVKMYNFICNFVLFA